MSSSPLIFDPLLLRQGGFKLARSIKEAILGFFLPDAAEGEDSSK